MKKVGSVDIDTHCMLCQDHRSFPKENPADFVNDALLFCFLSIYAIGTLISSHPHLLYEIALKVNSTTAKVPAETGIALTHVGKIPLQNPPIPPCLQVCLKQSVIVLYF